MNTSTLRGALNAALRLPDDKVKAAISKILASTSRRPVRPLITGRFDTRAELEAHVWRVWKKEDPTQEELAKLCRVSPATVANILRLKPLPLPDQPISHKGQPGLVHHAFRSSIAPSGILVGVYRHGPRKNYLGYLDASQVEITA